MPMKPENDDKKIPVPSMIAFAYILDITKKIST